MIGAGVSLGAYCSGHESDFENLDQSLEPANQLGQYNTDSPPGPVPPPELQAISGAKTWAEYAAWFDAHLGGGNSATFPLTSEQKAALEALNIPEGEGHGVNLAEDTAP